jgi:hypothetical protein
MDPTKKELYTAKRTTNIDVSDSAISDHWNDIRSEDSSESWLLLRVDGSKAAVYASGTFIHCIKLRTYLATPVDWLLL